MEHGTKSLEVIPADKKKIKHIWTITLYLFLITACEFVVAFSMDSGTIKTIIFVVMTIVKAYYIIFEFMHLGHEEKGLKKSIMLPLLFVVWLIAALLIQGEALFTALFGG